MADQKGSNIGKALQKRVFRAKEKVLQNLGKADKTRDDILDEHVSNFGKQQVAASKLQKELKNYVNCSKAMNVASRSLFETMQEIYEEEWSDREQVLQVKNSSELLWGDLLQKLHGDVCAPLQNYITQFPDTKTKISKRGRKLVDYDSARHNVESLESAKKRDEAKIAKAHDELQEAKQIYELMNNQLHEELPSLYESRVVFTCTNLQSLANAESIFHAEFSKLLNQLNDAVENLARENSKGTYKVKRASVRRTCSLPNGDSAVPGHVYDEYSNKTGIRHEGISPSLSNNSARSHSSGNSGVNPDAGPDFQGGIDLTDSSKSSVSMERKHSNQLESPGEMSPVLSSDEGVMSGEFMAEIHNALQAQAVLDDSEDPLYSSIAREPVGKKQASPTADRKESAALNGVNTDKSQTKTDPEDYEPFDAPVISESTYEELENADPEPKATEPVEEGSIYSQPGEDIDVYQVPPSNQGTKNAPPNMLYKVQATHPYKGEDRDELCFEAGEFIYVIAYDDPEEQDEGWLMGVNQESGEKGVFPANFTKPI